jgi:hypothetical protein
VADVQDELPEPEPDPSSTDAEDEEADDELGLSAEESLGLLPTD